MTDETPARERILLAAMDLFHAQGVAATSPRQIMDASDTGQSQLYHYFGNKAGLVEAVLRAHIAAIEGGMGPIQHHVESWADVRAWFETYIQIVNHFSMRRGCPLAAIARDVQGDDALRELAAEALGKVVSCLQPFFEGEIEAGRLASDDARGLAQWCVAIMEGAVLLGQVQRSPAPIRAAFDHALAYLEGLRR